MSSGDRQSSHDLVDASNTGALSAKPTQPLANRLIAAFFTTAFLLVLAASAILYWGTISALQSADDQVLDKRADVVIDILSAKEFNEGMLAHEVNEDNQGPRQIFMRVISDQPGVAVETEWMRELLGADLFPAGKLNAPFSPQRKTIRLPDGRTYRAASVSVPLAAIAGAPPAILQVATDTTLDNRSLTLFQKILWSVISAALPLCAAASWYLVKRELKPLDRITAAARAIHGENINRRIALHDMPAELHNLATQFNAMLSRLESTWNDLKNYADATAHELRTPLNRMRLQCEIAVNNAQSLDEAREVLNATLDECERMSKLLQGLLFLARVDSNQASISPQRLQLAQHLITLADYFEPEATEAGLSFKATCPPDLWVNADRPLLQQAIANLVSNAIAHTGRGGCVTIEAVRSNGSAEISVKDTGEGIAPEHHERLFDRYYRASSNPEATKMGGRIGLGLSITKSIIELHGGRVSISSTLGQGTCVTLTLPAETAPENLKEAAE